MALLDKVSLDSSPAPAMPSIGMAQPPYLLIGVIVGGGAFLWYLSSRPKTKETPPVQAPPSQVQEAPAASMSIVTSPATVKPGDQYTITVRISKSRLLNASGIISISGEIRATSTESGVIHKFEVDSSPLQVLNLQATAPSDPGRYGLHTEVFTGPLTGVRQVLAQADTFLVVQEQAAIPQGPVQLPPPVLANQTISLQAWPPSIRLLWTNPSGTRWIKFEAIPTIQSIGSIAIPSIQQVIAVSNSFSIPMPRIGEGQYNLLPNLTYKYRVYASGAASMPEANDESRWGLPAEGTFTTPPSTGTTIRLISPSNGQVLDSKATVQLRWTNSDSNIFMYRIQISTDKAFSASSVDDLATHGGLSNPLDSFNFQPTRDGVYYWRVQPLNGNDWSSVGNFTSGSTSAPTPPAPPAAPRPDVLLWGIVGVNPQQAIFQVSHVPSESVEYLLAYATNMSNPDDRRTVDPNGWVQFGERITRDNQTIVLEKIVGGNTYFNTHYIYIALEAWKGGQVVKTGNPYAGGYDPGMGKVVAN